MKDHLSSKCAKHQQKEVSMRKIPATIILVLLMLIAGLSQGFAACTKDEVENAVNHAADLLESKGKAAFTELDTYRFCGEEGYIFIFDMNAVCLFHPISSILVGKDQTLLQDAKGKYLVAEMLNKAKNQGYGWVPYHWLNPKSNTIDVKCTYVKRCKMDGQDVWVGSGVYGIPEAECR